MGCKEQDPLIVAKDYLNTVNFNIELFLKDKTNKMQFTLEQSKDDFIQFCELINAEVNLELAMKEFEIKYNAS
jgi:hypothetical protein